MGLHHQGHGGNPSRREAAMTAVRLALDARALLGEGPIWDVTDADWGSNLGSDSISVQATTFWGREL